MAKKGYVLRKDIELAITSELVKKGVEKARNKARAYLSDYKKVVEKSTNSVLILNTGSLQNEQYKCQELGEWLYQRKGVLKAFRTPVCPCSLHFDLSITEKMDISDASIALNNEEGVNPKFLINTLLQQHIINEKEKADLKKRLAEFEKKEAKTKEKRRAAGKAGGRGRTNWL